MRLTERRKDIASRYASFIYFSEVNYRLPAHLVGINRSKTKDRSRATDDGDGFTTIYTLYVRFGILPEFFEPDNVL